MTWIVAEIEARGGAVPFDEFMELALYHPEHGYYSGRELRYGRSGDYLTAPTASEWYSRVFARVLSSTARGVGPLRLVDVASGDGSFIAGVLESLGAGADEVLADVVSVERSGSMRSRQVERLGQTSIRVGWIESVSELEPAGKPTVLHASELYDAQPVVRVVGRDGGVREFWIDVGGGAPAWSERPPRGEVAAYFERQRVTLEEGQIAEANLTADGMHRLLLSAAGDCGLCLVLDYGYEARRLYDPRGRGGGSLTTFHRHRLGRDPLESPGEVDLTAHVNWDDLRFAAKAVEWAEIGLWPLAEFLVRAGLEDELEERGLGMEADLDAATITTRQEIKRLVDPEGMGSDLKVLIQAKGEMVDVAQSVLSLPQ
jgi:SAM-dependent MidA family methyltransferase